MDKGKVVNVFKIYEEKGLEALKKDLNNMNEKELYLIQKKYFYKIIKNNKEDQIKNILIQMENVLNIGWVFSGIPYRKLT